jgi:multidrug efflux pump subunit AcrA (membrane-fusion protein)
MAEYNLKQVQQYLDNAQEELDQLQKMYDADELTEETEEIVLKRQRFEVEYAKFYLEYAKINRDYTMDVSIPQRDLALQTSVDKTKLMLEEAKTAKSLGLSKKRYELEALRERRARSVENHAKLVADKALMTLRAPRDGVVYYGRCVDGRWGEVSSYQSKLIPSGSISPNAVLMTVVSERPLRIETSIGEKDLPSVAAGQTVTLSPAADSEMELTAKVKSVESIPRGGNQFTVEIELGKDELAEWLKAGMTCKANIRVYEKDDAVVIPADLVQSEEDSPKNKYVMVQVKGEKEPQRRDLKIGKKKDKEVEVLKGLQPGDLIVKGAKDDQDKDDDDE